MVFSRLFFIYLFFPICFLCYFATKKTSYRNAVLIVFSLLFYACVTKLVISCSFIFI